VAGEEAPAFEAGVDGAGVDGAGVDGAGVDGAADPESEAEDAPASEIPLDATALAPSSLTGVEENPKYSDQSDDVADPPLDAEDPSLPLLLSLCTSAYI
jgi:hypothetical protein